MHHENEQCKFPGSKGLYRCIIDWKDGYLDKAGFKIKESYSIKKPGIAGLFLLIRSRRNQIQTDIEVKRIP